VLELEPVQWKGGQVHQQSGDRAYHLDFSEVRQGGVYYVLDAESSVRSALFRISNDVYRDVLKHAVRTFFYQRAGFAKEAKYAGAAWEDGASHVRPGQDKDARLYSATNDASTARDVSGGWYDAGDYNKYTPWTADYVVTLLRAYEENPGVFGDDYGLPESGNGVSDLLVWS
jgi:endoglucanase